MSKVLKINFPDDCIGCELCVMEAQRQLKKVGLDDALIRVFREDGKFTLSLDPRVNNLDLERIREVCPKANFSIVEEESDYELLG